MISFFRRSRSTIGLDIGSSTVKAVSVDHGGSSPLVTAIAHHPLPPGAILEGEIVNAEAVAAGIRSAIEALGVPPRCVVTAVGGRDIMVKKIRMDRMAAVDAREAIRWEAEQYVPFEMSGVQLDFQVLDVDADGPEMDVLLVAAKRELVDQRLALLKAAGLSASVVDVAAFALHNAFVQNYPQCERGIAALVDIGREGSTILIQQEGVPVLNRDVPFGTRSVEAELQRAHDLASEEAERLVRGGDERPETYASTFDEALAALAMHIERTLAFLAIDGVEGSGVSTIYLSGGGARMPRLAEVLAGSLHARIEVANPLQRLRVHPAAGGQLGGGGIAPMLMQAVGLGLRMPGGER